MRIELDQVAITRFLATHQPLALDHYSEQVKDRAQDRAPVRSEDLKNSIEIDRDDEQRGIHYVGSELPYASVAEFGERKDGTYRWKTGPTHFLSGAIFHEEGSE